MKKIVVLLFLVLLFVPLSASAIKLNLSYPVFNFPPPIGTLDINTDQSLPTVLLWVFRLLVGISGLAAFIMLVIGGFQWLTSVGDVGRISDARDRIKKALLGLLIILSSVIIVGFLNPELTNPSLSGLKSLVPVGLNPPTGPGGPVGQVALAVVGGDITPPLGSTIGLTWSVGSNFIKCTAGNDWSGQKSLPTGIEAGIGPLTLSQYTFSLLCDDSGGGPPISFAVTVFPGSSGVGPEPVIDIWTVNDSTTTIVVFQASKLTMKLRTTDADDCLGGPFVPQIQGAISADFTQTLGIAPGTYEYDVTCTNSSSGKTTSSSVIVIVL